MRGYGGSVLVEYKDQRGVESLDQRHENMTISINRILGKIRVACSGSVFDNIRIKI